MGARISSMSADVATPPTSEWQALATSFALDSARSFLSDFQCPVSCLSPYIQKSRMTIRNDVIVCGNEYGFDSKQLLYCLTISVSRESFELASEMGARISSMSADVATPPTSEWQALATSFALDSATVISRLLLLFIFITIPACGLHLHMRKRSSVSDDGEEPREEIEMNDLHSAEGPSSFTGAVAVSTFSAANTALQDAVSIPMNDSS